MVSKLRIIPLGGLGEIGKNMTAFEYGNDIIVVDCGMGFPDEDMYGIDIVLPDFSYLKNNAARIRGIILTHGHEDHIGAIPYVLRKINPPIYATRLTAGLVKIKLEEHKLLKQAQKMQEEMLKTQEELENRLEELRANSAAIRDEIGEISRRSS